MRQRRAWGWVAGAVVGVALWACGPLHDPAGKDPDLSAERLEHMDGPSPIYDALAPEEREALEQADLSGLAEPMAVNDITALSEADESKLDTAGKAGFSFFVVAATLAALAAPFFAF